MKPLYLSETIRQTLPDAIRPGGLKLTRRVLELIDCKGKQIVDAGCGTAISLSLFFDKGATGIGFDTNTELLQQAKKRAVPAFCCTMDKIALLAESCDVVLSECAWNLSDKARSLTEFYRILRPGGMLVLSDIYTRGESPETWPVPCCFASATSLEFVVEYVEEAGFNVIITEDYTHLLQTTAAEFVFAYGSLEGFWESITGDHNTAKMACSAGKRSRPGLFLLLAKKPAILDQITSL